jgi:hypothetical protein
MPLERRSATVGARPTRNGQAGNALTKSVAACWGDDQGQAIGHQRQGLDRLYNFDLRCEAFAKVSDHVAALIGAREGVAQRDALRWLRHK